MYGLSASFGQRLIGNRLNYGELSTRLHLRAEMDISTQSNPTHILHSTTLTEHDKYIAVPVNPILSRCQLFLMLVHKYAGVVISFFLVR